MWTKIQAWLASKGGFSHVAATLFAAAIAAYAVVPAFHTFVLTVFNLLPPWGHELILAGIGLAAWYKNTQVAPDSGGIATSQPFNSRNGSLLGVALLLLVAPLLMAANGCNGWERTTYQSLAASKAVIDQAQADYEGGTIPKTTAAYALITDAKKAQTTAVEAMVAYETVKTAKGAAAAEAGAQQTAIAALVVIPQLILEIKALYNYPNPTVAHPITMQRRSHWIGGPLWT